MMRRLSHSVAALCAAGGLVLGWVALAGTAASATDQRPIGKVSGTTSFDCTAGSFPNFTYDATVTVTAYRETAGATEITLVGELSDMPGVIPVSLGKIPITDELTLDLGGQSATLEGNGNTTITAGTAFPVPDLYGDFSSAATSVSAAVTTFDYALPSFNMGGTCTPTSGAALGTLTIETGPAPTPSAMATATATATSTATATATATESSSGEGSPAKGDVEFACVLQPLNSEFDYPTTITVSGYREEEGGDVNLSAKMTDIPGISPVQIDGDMEVTLDATVGGTPVTLKGSSHVSEAPRAKVPVPKLTGTVSADADEMEIVISAFEFEIVTTGLTVTAPCEADPTSIGAMKVGTEAPDDEETDDPSPSATSSPSTAPGGGSLPQTGGTDAMPVIVLWAGALTLLGVAGLIAVPQVVRRGKHG